MFVRWLFALFALLSLLPKSALADRHAQVSPDLDVHRVFARAAYNCEKDLTYGEPFLFLPPYYTETNSPAPDLMGRGNMRHKFGGFTSFSRNGKYVLVHHDIYPNAEQLSVRRVDDGVLVATFLWRGKNGHLADLRSAAVDGEAGHLIAIGNNWSSDRSEEILDWKYGEGGPVERIQLEPAPSSDYFPTPIEAGHSTAMRSVISTRHPFYLRLNYSSSGPMDWGKAKFLVELFDREQRGFRLRIEDTYPRLETILPALRAFSPEFQFMALPSADRLRVNVTSFGEIRRQIAREAAKLAERQQSPDRPGDAPSLPSPMWNRVFSEKISRLFPSSWRAFWGGPLSRSRRSSASSDNQGVALLADVPAGNDGPVEPVTIEGFETPLIHDKPIKQMRVVSWAPMVVTQTDDGLFVWNAQTGTLVAKVPEAKSDFRVFEHMGVIAYVLPDREIGLYSVLERREIARMANFAQYSLNFQIDNWQEGVAFLTDDSGAVYKLAEKRPAASSAKTDQAVTVATMSEPTTPSSATTYDLVNTGLTVAMPLNTVRRTYMTTEKDSYFIQVYERSRIGGARLESRDGGPAISSENQSGHELVVQFYSLTNGKLVKEVGFVAGAFQSAFTMDPGRTRVFFTASDTDTGFIHLPNLLERLGL